MHKFLVDESHDPIKTRQKYLRNVNVIGFLMRMLRCLFTEFDASDLKDRNIFRNMIPNYDKLSDAKQKAKLEDRVRRQYFFRLKDLRDHRDEDGVKSISDVSLVVRTLTNSFVKRSTPSCHRLSRAIVARTSSFL